MVPKRKGAQKIMSYIHEIRVNNSGEIDPFKTLSRLFVAILLFFFLKSVIELSNPYNRDRVHPAWLAL